MKKRVAILMAFCVTTLTGCVTGGFSDWDGSPTEHTVQKKEDKVQHDINNMQLASNRILQYQPPQNVTNEMKKLLYKMKKLNSSVESGHINYREFSRQTNDIKSDFDIFKSEYRDQNDSIVLLSIPVISYYDAANDWSKSFNTFANLARGHLYDRDTNLEIASATLRILDDTLYKLKK